MLIGVAPPRTIGVADQPTARFGDYFSEERVATWGPSSSWGTTERGYFDELAYSTL